MSSDTPFSRSSRSKKSQGLPTAWGAPITCQFCSGQEFRRSKRRTDDISQLLLLSYPVRCIRCGERQYVSFAVAAVSLSSSKRQPRPARRSSSSSKETNWSEPQERMTLGSRQDEPPPPAS